jgi:hypothetical protein
MKFILIKDNVYTIIYNYPHALVPVAYYHSRPGSIVSDRYELYRSGSKISYYKYSN